MHPDEMTIDLLHRSASREAQNKMRVGAQVVRHDTRDQRGGSGFSGLDDDFHESLKQRFNDQDGYSFALSARVSITFFGGTFSLSSEISSAPDVSGNGT